MSNKPARIEDLTPAELDAARAAVRHISSDEEGLHLRTWLEAMRKLAKKAGRSLDEQNAWAAVRLDADRRRGELLAAIDLDPGGRPSQNPSHDARGFTLADLGLTYSESSRLQRLAAIDTDRYEEWKAQTQDAGLELTAAGALRLYAIPKPAPIPPPEGTYRCIVIDPPWPMAKITRDVRPNQGDKLSSTTYHTRTLEEIASDPIRDLADPSGAHVYLWVTHKFLPAGLQLLQAWGCRYECVLTWVKPVGMTPYSFMYDTEHVLFARAGKGLKLTQQGRRLSFSAPAEGHSVKPDAFYDLVRTVSPGPRLEMYARRAHAGFTPWGDQAVAA